MTYKIAFQMDKVDKLNLKTDTTLRLIWEAIRRNHKVYYYTPKDLILEDNQVKAHLYIIEATPEDISKFKVTYYKKTDLTEMDYIFIRQDPPFDMPYLTSTYLLEKIKDRTKIINNPTEIRNSPEKILVTNFPNLIPPTLMTANIEDIKEFLQIHKKIVLKPLYAHGGRDVFLIKENDPNLLAIFQHLTKEYNDLIIAQKFLEEINEGDKRIIIINGEPSYALLRIPQNEQIRSNIAIGGSAQKTTLSQRDKEICLQISSTLKERDLQLVGIDVIGDYLTEINVTSPTGIAIINDLYKIRLEEKILDDILT